MSKLIILCVDDEPTILKTLKTQIKEHFGSTYSYEVAENADDALELVEELIIEEDEIIVIVSDWLMPGMKGDELLIEIHKKSPNSIKILLTGQADCEAIQRAREQANLHRCIRKPWSNQELIDTLESALSQY